MSHGIVLQSMGYGKFIQLVNPLYVVKDLNLTVFLCYPTHIFKLGEFTAKVKVIDILVGSVQI